MGAILIAAAILFSLFWLPGILSNDDVQTTIQTSADIEQEAYDAAFSGDYAEATTLFQDAKQLAAEEGQSQSKIDELQQQYEYALYERDRVLNTSSESSEAPIIDSTTVDGATYYTTQPQD